MKHERKCITQNRIIVFIIAAFITGAVFCPAVLASGTVDGQENRVIPGGTVYQGIGTVKLIGFGNDVDYFIHESGKPFLTIQNGKVIISQDQKTGEYQAYNETSNVVFSEMSFTVAAVEEKKLTLTLSSKVAQPEDTITVKISGTPYKKYTVSVSQGGPIFVETGGVKQTVTMEVSGEMELDLSIPFTTTQGTYEVVVTGEDGRSERDSFSVSVIKTTTKLTFEYVSNDVRNGIFAVGDVMYLTGNLDPQPTSDYSESFYLFITGHALPKNGVNLRGDRVIDGDETSFTKIDYDNDKKCWEYYWDTSGFEPGMYTLHIAFEPIGFSAGTAVGGEGSASQEISLSDKSIHVKFAEENGGIFTQGDVMYSYWSARGSPNAVRWYIIGPNFMETGIEEDFPLYTPDQEFGKDAPQGLSGFTSDRTVSNSMAAGTYYLVYQHPGFNDKFDVWPTSGNTHLETNFGESASLEGRPSSNCAETLQTLINSVRSDDLCVISEITLEEPEITIDQVDHLEIGDKLKIKGTTNYAGEGVTADGTEVKNTFSLTVNRLDFDLAEENAAMKLQIVNRVVPQNVIPYYGERTYAFDEIDTSTWFEGTYQATVTNIDTGFSESIMFTVGGEGVEQDSATLQVPSDPLEAPDTSLEPLPPIIDYSEPVEPEEPKSPGFLLAPLAFAAAFALRRK